MPEEESESISAVEGMQLVMTIIIEHAGLRSHGHSSCVRLEVFLGVRNVRYHYSHFTDEKYQRFGPNDLLQNNISGLAFEYRFF